MSALTIILIIIVVLVLFSYLYMVYKKYKNTKRQESIWPPTGTPLACPDFWVNKGNGLCHNPSLLGTGEGTNKQTPISQKNFMNISNCTLGKLNDPSCLKSKCDWARQTNNPWFGVLPDCKKGQNCYCPA